jgi:hypothetical protein
MSKQGMADATLRVEIDEWLTFGERRQFGRGVQRKAGEGRMEKGMMSVDGGQLSPTQGPKACWGMGGCYSEAQHPDPVYSKYRPP